MRYEYPPFEVGGYQYVKIQDPYNIGNTDVNYWRRRLLLSTSSYCYSVQEKKNMIFNVIVTQKVIKNVDAAGNEKVNVERVVLNKTGIAAPDSHTAALIAGREIPTGYDSELLSSAVVKVTQITS